RRRRALDPGLDDDLPGAVRPLRSIRGLVARAGDDAQPADRADRRQGLAAKAERADLQDVVVRQFRGAMALDREVELVAAHALAVVADRDQTLAAVAQYHLDVLRAGVDRILDQFLD